MSQLTKPALQSENQTNFPNNNTGYITPSLLREFNSDMIDSLALQSQVDGISASVVALTAESGTWATTGSNTFNGNQTINSNLYVSHSNSINVGSTFQIIDTNTGITLVDSQAGVQIRNFSGGELQIDQNANGDITIINHLQDIHLTTPSGAIFLNDVDFEQYSASVDYRLNNAQGVQGTTGAQGAVGTQGATGQSIQGVQGIKGDQGIQGFVGIQGAQGYIGNAGTNGSQGATGLQGPIGTQGTTGAGTQGVQGIQGPTNGAQGSQGPQGTTGAGTQGATGTQGSQGTVGSGSQGVQGIQGIQGSGTTIYTGSFAITGSNTFVGNQTMDNVSINSTNSGQLAFTSGSPFIISNNNGWGLQINVDSGVTSRVLQLRNVNGDILITGSSTTIQGTNWNTYTSSVSTQFSASTFFSGTQYKADSSSFNSRINAITGSGTTINTGSFITTGSVNTIQAISGGLDLNTTYTDTSKGYNSGSGGTNVWYVEYSLVFGDDAPLWGYWISSNFANCVVYGPNVPSASVSSVNFGGTVELTLSTGTVNNNQLYTIAGPAFRDIQVTGSVNATMGFNVTNQINGDAYSVSAQSGMTAFNVSKNFQSNVQPGKMEVYYTATGTNIGFEATSSVNGNNDIPYENGPLIYTSYNGNTRPMFGFQSEENWTNGTITALRAVNFTSGSNQQSGKATLNGANPGTVTVSNSLVTANSLIFLTKQSNTHPGSVSISAKSSGSFTITSTENGDNDVVAWFISNPL